MARPLKSREALEAIFRPKSVAVIGASSSPEKWGFKIFKNIIDAGFQGPLYPINPRGGEILGFRCYPSVKEVEGAIDLGVIVIPAKLAPEAIRDLGEKGIKAAIDITGRFSEVGPEGEALQRRLVEEAERYGVSVIGPNCQGVNNPYHGFCASWPLLKERGHIAILSQSGTVGAALMDWAAQERLGVSAFVSMGNRADVDEADLIAYLNTDEHTKAIALYLEGVKDAPKFLEAVKGLKKPLIVLKPGRTEAGRRAAESHTKSLAGKDEVYRGVFKQFHIHRAETLEELYDFAKALAYLNRPKGKKILIVTSSGGSGVIATDQAAEEGLDVAPLPQTLAEQLRSFLPSHFIVGNPLDLTGDATAELYRQVAEAAAPHYDTIVLLFGDPIEGASEVVSKDRGDLVIFL
ncbi:MAG: acetate--CoA ligase family protein, partial [Candidatus Methylomirabilales bacterium]